MYKFYAAVVSIFNNHKNHFTFFQTLFEIASKDLNTALFFFVYEIYLAKQFGNQKY